MELGFRCRVARKGFNHHGPMATVSSVSYHKGEVVGLVRHSSDHLGDHALPPSNKLNCVQAKWYGEMGLVKEPHGLEGLDDPTRQGRCQVFLLWRKEDARSGVLEDMRALFKPSILHQVICRQGRKRQTRGN